MVQKIEGVECRFEFLPKRGLSKSRLGCRDPLKYVEA